MSQTENTLSNLHGFNSGYINTIGFLGLNGLFSAMITGNYVTLASGLITGSSGSWLKVAALPTFCIIIILSTVICRKLEARGIASKRKTIVTMVIFLGLAAYLMITNGPFADVDAAPAFAAGLLMVGAMAIQNAMQKLYLAKSPSAHLMTGNTTQVMMDIGQLLSGLDKEARANAVTRLKKIAPAIVIYAMGCAMGALAFVQLGMWGYLISPFLVASTLMFSGETSIP